MEWPNIRSMVLVQKDIVLSAVVINVFAEQPLSLCRMMSNPAILIKIVWSDVLHLA